MIKNNIAKDKNRKSIDLAKKILLILIAIISSFLLSTANLDDSYVFAADASSSGSSGLGNAAGGAGQKEENKWVAPTINYIARINVGGLSGYVRLNNAMTRAEIYVDGEEVFSVNVVATETGTTKITSIGVGNTTSDAGSVSCLTTAQLETTDTDYIGLSTYDGADTLIIKTSTTDADNIGVLKTSGSTAVSVKEFVYSDGSIVKTSIGGPIDYSSALSSLELSYITPQDALSNMRATRMRFEVHHVDTSVETNVFSDIYAYKDSDGNVIFYKDVITSVVSATYDSTEAVVWYKLCDDGTYEKVNDSGVVIDTARYVYDASSDAMISA